MAGKEFKFLQKIEMEEQFNRLGEFKAHENKFYFSRTSLFFLSSENGFRKFLVWLITWEYGIYFAFHFIIGGSNASYCSASFATQ
jgi:hypothetical protein